MKKLIRLYYLTKILSLGMIKAWNGFVIGLIGVGNSGTLQENRWANYATGVALYFKIFRQINPLSSVLRCKSVTDEQKRNGNKKEVDSMVKT